jgi:hypothetical protein
MPEISRFYGISIYLYPREHPPAHFHAFYGDGEAVFEIATLRIIAGDIPNRARALVLDWATEHQGELALRGIDSARDETLAKLPRWNNLLEFLAS